ncbi:MAG: electron transport complex subunit RsxA [Firmicutes bacterium]|nr:electron transport complex subunit RsxA [Bacillota bacterium]
MNILGIMLSAIIVDNFVLSKIMGICPFMGVSSKVKPAVGMGAAVTFVMALASVITHLLYTMLLEPFGITYLRTVAFILVIASLVQLVEIVIKRVSATLYEALGVYLPLITTNCAVLGVTILNIDNKYSIIEALVSGIGGALGFALALILLAAIRERQETADIPAAMRGKPIALITAGLMSLAFLGFSGMLK